MNQIQERYWEFIFTHPWLITLGTVLGLAYITYLGIKAIRTGNLYVNDQVGGRELISGKTARYIGWLMLFIATFTIFVLSGNLKITSHPFSLKVFKLCLGGICNI